MANQTAISRLGRVRFALAAIILATGWAQAAPQISNVVATQRPDGSGLVDISYDLEGSVGPVTVFVHLSEADAISPDSSVGASWRAVPSLAALSGAVGSGVSNGTGLQIVWDAGLDIPGVLLSDLHIHLTATETASAGTETTIWLPWDAPGTTQAETSYTMLTMVRLPAGTFRMGSEFTDPWGQANERPARQVSLVENFEMGKFEVTRGQWYAVMGSDPGIYPSGATMSVDDAQGASFTLAQGFIAALNAHVEATGQGPATFRLPSEAEWEYAARAGTETHMWHGDLTCPVSSSCQTCVLNPYAWYCSNTSSPRIVGEKLPNPFGLHDMYGNRREWCLDITTGSADYLGAPLDGSPRTQPSSSNRAVRGGAWSSAPLFLRSASRTALGTQSNTNANGFRLVRTLPAEPAPAMTAHGFSAPLLLDTMANLDPPNEVFASAQVLEGLAGAVQGSTIGAIREPNERMHAGTYTNSVWYQWTPIWAGNVVFHTCAEASFDTVLAVYRGSSLSALTQLTTNDNGSGCEAGRSRVSFNFVPGETYRVAIGGANGEEGTFTLTWQATVTPPTNDNFWGPTLTGSTGSVFGTTAFATRQPREPQHAHVFDGGTVWYSWNAPAPGPATFSTCRETDFDSRVTIFTGTKLDTLRRIPTIEEDCPTLGHTVHFTATTETTYRIGVAGRTGLEGAFTLTWSAPVAPPPPGNDHFPGLILEAPRGIVEGTTQSATRQSGEPSHAGQSQSGSVWYSWRPTEVGIATFGTCAFANFDTAISVYRGGAVNSLTRIVDNDDFCAYGRSHVSFTAWPETMYRIAVAGKATAMGRFALEWDFQPTDSTDDGWEPNNTWMQAKQNPPLHIDNELRGLVLNDEDWYRILVGSEETLFINVQFEHDKGDINVELYDARAFDSRGWPIRIGEAYSPRHPWIWNPDMAYGQQAPSWLHVPWGPPTADNEWISWANGIGATEVYLRVYGEDGAKNPEYSIEILMFGEDDKFEPNNEIDQAAELTLDAPELGLVGKDNDYFRVDVSQVDAIRVRVAAYALLGSLYFEVYGRQPDGTLAPLEESKMYTPNLYEGTRTVCVRELDEVIVRVYPAVRRANIYNLAVETVAGEECP